MEFDVCYRTNVSHLFILEGGGFVAVTCLKYLLFVAFSIAGLHNGTYIAFTDIH